MELIEVKKHLCYYDKRNPCGYHVNVCESAGECDCKDIKARTLQEHKEVNCFCDNCYRGKTELAEEILRLRKKVQGLGIAYKKEKQKSFGDRFVTPD